MGAAVREAGPSTCPGVGSPWYRAGRGLPLLGVVIAILTLPGCGERSQRAGPEHSPSDSAVRLQLEWSAGSAAAPGVVLSDVKDLAWSPGGPVAVLEGQNRSVALLDSEGQPLTRLGGHGPGPSELLQPINLGFVGDTLWVADPGTNSVKFWLSSSAFLTSTSFQFSSTGTGKGPNTVNGYLGRGVYVTVDGPRSTNAVVNRVDTTRTYYLTTETGDVVDRLGTVSLSDSKIGVRNEGDRYRGIYGDQPISDDAFFAFGSDQRSAMYEIHRPVATSSGRDSFLVRRYGPEGATSWTEYISYDPVVVSSLFRDSLISVWAGHAHESKGVQTASREQARRLARGALFLPDYLPPVRDAAVAPSGALWLEMWSDPWSERRMLIVAPTGDVCGRARMQPGLEFLAATEHGILVGGNEGGVPTVKYFAAKSLEAC